MLQCIRSHALLTFYYNPSLQCSIFRILSLLTYCLVPQVSPSEAQQAPVRDPLSTAASPAKLQPGRSLVEAEAANLSLLKLQQELALLKLQKELAELKQRKTLIETQAGGDACTAASPSELKAAPSPPQQEPSSANPTGLTVDNSYPTIPAAAAVATAFVSLPVRDSDVPAQHLKPLLKDSSHTSADIHKMPQVPHVQQQQQAPVTRQLVIPSESLLEVVPVKSGSPEAVSTDPEQPGGPVVMGAWSKDMVAAVARPAGGSREGDGVEAGDAGAHQDGSVLSPAGQSAAASTVPLPDDGPVFAELACSVVTEHAPDATPVADKQDAAAIIEPAVDAQPESGQAGSSESAAASAVSVGAASASDASLPHSATPVLAEVSRSADHEAAEGNDSSAGMHASLHTFCKVLSMMDVLLLF